MPYNHLSRGGRTALDLGFASALDQALDPEIEQATWFLPPGYPYDGRFLRQMVASLAVLAYKIPLGGSLASTAEELFMAHVLDEALSREELMRDAGKSRADHSEELTRFKAALYEDYDHEWLYDPRMDGIEHMPEVGAANLGFTDWFKPFREEERVINFVWSEEARAV